MPTYEYECQSCHHHLEVEQRMSDAALKKCPHCKKDKLQRIISATNFQLKGGGWYVTDHRDKTKTTSKPSDVKAKSDSDTPKDVTPAKKEKKEQKKSTTSNDIDK
jgi:putative FmdB family regulatory protein